MIVVISQTFPSHVLLAVKMPKQFFAFMGTGWGREAFEEQRG